MVPVMCAFKFSGQESEKSERLDDYMAHICLGLSSGVTKETARLPVYIVIIKQGGRSAMFCAPKLFMHCLIYGTHLTFLVSASQDAVFEKMF